MLPPAITVCELGEAETEKSGVGGAFTTNPTVVVWLKLPLLPVMVRVALPAGVLEVVDTVRVEVVLPLIEAGLNEAVAPAGRPLTLSVTVPLNPFKAVTVVV